MEEEEAAVPPTGWELTKETFDRTMTLLANGFGSETLATFMSRVIISGDPALDLISLCFALADMIHDIEKNPKSMGPLFTKVIGLLFPDVDMENIWERCMKYDIKKDMTPSSDIFFKQMAQFKIACSSGGGACSFVLPRVSEKIFTADSKSFEFNPSAPIAIMSTAACCVIGGDAAIADQYDDTPSTSIAQIVDNLSVHGMPKVVALNYFIDRAGRTPDSNCLKRAEQWFIAFGDIDAVDSLPPVVLKLDQLRYIGMKGVRAIFKINPTRKTITCTIEIPGYEPPYIIEYGVSARGTPDNGTVKSRDKNGNTDKNFNEGKSEVQDFFLSRMTPTSGKEYDKNTIREAIFRLIFKYLGDALGPECASRKVSVPTTDRGFGTKSMLTGVKVITSITSADGTTKNVSLDPVCRVGLRQWQEFVCSSDEIRKKYIGRDLTHDEQITMQKHRCMFVLEDAFNYTLIEEARSHTSVSHDKDIEILKKIKRRLFELREDTSRFLTYEELKSEVFKFFREKQKVGKAVDDPFVFGMGAMRPMSEPEIVTSIFKYKQPKRPKQPRKQMPVDTRSSAAPAFSSNLAPSSFDAMRSFAAPAPAAGIQQLGLDRMIQRTQENSLRDERVAAADEEMGDYAVAAAAAAAEDRWAAVDDAMDDAMEDGAVTAADGVRPFLRSQAVAARGMALSTRSKRRRLEVGQSGGGKSLDTIISKAELYILLDFFSILITSFIYSLLPVKERITLALGEARKVSSTEQHPIIKYLTLLQSFITRLFDFLTLVMMGKLPSTTPSSINDSDMSTLTQGFIEHRAFNKRLRGLLQQLLDKQNDTVLDDGYDKINGILKPISDILKNCTIILPVYESGVGITRDFGLLVQLGYIVTHFDGIVVDDIIVDTNSDVTSLSLDLAGTLKDFKEIYKPLIDNEEALSTSTRFVAFRQNSEKYIYEMIIKLLSVKKYIKPKLLEEWRLKLEEIILAKHKPKGAQLTVDDEYKILNVYLISKLLSAINETLTQQEYPANVEELIIKALCSNESEAEVVWSLFQKEFRYNGSYIARIAVIRAFISKVEFTGNRVAYTGNIDELLLINSHIDDKLLLKMEFARVSLGEVIDDISKKRDDSVIDATSKDSVIREINSLIKSREFGIVSGMKPGHSILSYIGHSKPLPSVVAIVATGGRGGHKIKTKSKYGAKRRVMYKKFVSKYIIKADKRGNRGTQGGKRMSGANVTRRKILKRSRVSKNNVTRKNNKIHKIHKIHKKKNTNLHYNLHKRHKTLKR
jgi:hypothetical protein